MNAAHEPRFVGSIVFFYDKSIVLHTQCCFIFEYAYL